MSLVKFRFLAVTGDPSPDAIFTPFRPFPELPTFENTVEALELAGESLTRGGIRG